MKLEEGLAIVKVGIAKAEELACKVGIAVVDSRGDLVAHVRTDGVSRYAADMARGKAMVSAIYKCPSHVPAGDDPVNRRMNELAQDQLTFLQGAVPVFADGEQLGGVGVSGATGEQEEQIAMAAAEAVGTYTE